MKPEMKSSPTHRRIGYSTPWPLEEGNIICYCLFQCIQVLRMFAMRETLHDLEFEKTNSRISINGKKS